MWIAPEVKDPVLTHAPTRKSIACLGAVSLETGNDLLLGSYRHPTALQGLSPKHAGAKNASGHIGQTSHRTDLLVLLAHRAHFR
jgi:hypothetical protein